MKKRTKRGVITWTALLVFISLPVYYLLLDKPATINSGIYKLNKTIPAHKAPVWTVRYSHSGKFFVTGSVDSTVKIWTQEGTLIRTLKQPNGITSIDINSNDSLLATASYDGKVRIWEISSGRLLNAFDEQEKTVWCLAWNPVANEIAAGGEDHEIKIMNAAGETIRTLKGHSLNIWALKYTPDGNTIISGSFDRTIIVWNAKTGATERKITGHDEAVVDLAISHDGKIFASGSDDKTIKLWQVNDGKLITTLNGGDEHVQALAFTHDDNRLLSGGRDKSVPGELFQNFFGDSKINKGVSMRLWDLKTYKVIQTFSEHANDVNDISISPDDKLIVTASADMTSEIWKLSK